MQLNDKGQYQNNGVADLFLRSCLGKIVIVAVTTGLILLIASTTVPSKAKMEEEMNDNIQQCINECQGKATDGTDDLVRNAISTFTHADSDADKSMMETFRKHNRIEIYHHTFYKTAYLFNNSLPNGTRAGIGFFGMVIPMLDFNDFIMRMAPLRKEYNQRIVQNEFTADDDFDPDSAYVEEDDAADNIISFP